MVSAPGMAYVADVVAQMLTGRGATIAVVGALNLDHLTHVDRLPVTGETVIAHTLTQVPGGKGLNQAVAAARLGAQVELIAHVGDDPAGELLRRTATLDGVGTRWVGVSAGQRSGQAWVTTSSSGENTIVVHPGANSDIHLPPAAELAAFQASCQAVLCQLEVPLPIVASIINSAPGTVILNASPAARIPAPLIEQVALLIVNESEWDAQPWLHAAPLVAVTLGPRGALLMQDGRIAATSGTPKVDVIDTVGAGDAFAAALTLAMALGADVEVALRFGCLVGALSTRQAGSISALPRLADVRTQERDLGAW